MHTSVLLQECIDALAIKPDGTYIDGTFGRGGHTQKILAQLSPAGRLLVFDKDDEAITYAKQQYGEDPRVIIVHDSFAKLKDNLFKVGINAVDGVLLDLGVSSPQLDQAERGFSFMQEGPLDMRMDRQRGQSAAQWLAKAKEEEIADVLWRFGEERFSRRIARKIVQFRESVSFCTTTQLAELIARCVPHKPHHKNPATRSFQAIRIFINNELGDLESFLTQVPDVLNDNGRVVIISFHSLEDRLVKQTFRTWIQGESSGNIPRELIQAPTMDKPIFKSIVKKCQASADEQAINNRARSAIMRAVKRCVS